MAIGGMAAFGVWLAAFGVLIAIALVSNADNDPNNDPGALSEDDLAAVDDLFEDSDESELRIGDCVNDVAVGTPSIVPCSEPHEGEVYAKVYLSRYDTWPGDDTIQAEAEKCVDRLARISPASYDDQQVSIYYLQPTELTWSLSPFGGAKAVDCIAYFEDRNRTGSLPR